MTGMIERVARALAFEHVRSELHWQEWTEAACEAIEAMREPTSAVLNAGPPEPYMDKDVWSKMIDAALGKDL
jgi:hypothetical protein